MSTPSHVDELKALTDRYSSLPQKKWTLADDESIFHLFESFSQHLGQRVDQLSAQLEAVHRDIQGASIRLGNVESHFGRLPSKQFIESRVGEDDDDEHPSSFANRQSKRVKEPIAKTKQQRQEETIDSMKEAVSLGFSLIETRFTQINRLPEDFDEDDDPTFKPDPVFEPFDSHLTRPLPFIIGTIPFFQSHSIGLIEDEDEQKVQAGQREEERVVIRLRDEPKDSTTKMGQLRQEDNRRGNAGRDVDQSSSHRSPVESTKEEDDSSSTDHGSLFNEEKTSSIASSDRSSMVPVIVEKSIGQRPLTIKEELEKRFSKPSASASGSIVPETQKKPSSIVPVPNPSTSSELSKPLKPAVISDDEDSDLFAAQPAKVSTASKPAAASSAPVKTESNVPKQSANPTRSVEKPPMKTAIVTPKSPFVHRGLFDDDDEDDEDLFAPSIAKAVTTTVKKPMASTSTKQTPTLMKAPVVSVSKLKKSLFDDEDEDDDFDIFAPRKSNPPSVNVNRTASTSAATSSATESTLPKPSSSIVQSNPPMKVVKEPKPVDESIAGRLVQDEKHKVDGFTTSALVQEEAKSTSLLVNLVKDRPRPPANRRLPSKGLIRSTAVNQSEVGNAVNTLEEGEISAEIVSSQDFLSATSESTGINEPSTAAVESFGPMESATSTASLPRPTSTPSRKAETAPSKSTIVVNKTTKLFDDDDEEDDDLFAPSSASKTSKSGVLPVNKKNDSMVKKSESEKKTIKESTTKKKSLFDDDSDDDLDIFK